MSSGALEARLDDLRQVCSAPGDAYSAGEWCEAANEGVQIALALLAALAVAREREQHLREAVTAWDNSLSSYCDGPERDAVRAALVDEPAAATLAEPGIGESLADESPRNTDAGRSELAARSLHAPGSASAAADEPPTRCLACEGEFSLHTFQGECSAAPGETEQTP